MVHKGFLVGWLAIVLGVVLGSVALGLLGGPPAVLGLLAGVFIVAGVLLIVASHDSDVITEVTER